MERSPQLVADRRDAAFAPAEADRSTAPSSSIAVLP
jgi:hypothetical protein